MIESFPFCRVDMNMTAMDIAQIIMRQDNYLIALTNKGIVTKTIPKWLPESVMYSKVILWNFRMALFSQMFDRRYRIKMLQQDNIFIYALMRKIYESQWTSIAYEDVRIFEK
ncbi:autophagy protein apg9 protein [Cardiosporidium cionae]|uniref:Autophagy-related protein 9 n=1 Tax=Cardiosporidium cionae TaxID=476202 RepID=A0ABQ7J9R9_9APIC|nr:autophagy protein apg9 protein [Cardiosporidium cionae]|eukprot:KAF8820698.1 autophagy protein apg9 protein [Cardiosporidium cionae]